jgi:hypothetical protein
MCPEYDGTYSDADAFEVVQRLGIIIHAPEILFQHRHYTLGMTPLDSTYMKHNDPAANERNMQVFIQRAKRNFDL